MHLADTISWTDTSDLGLTMPIGQAMQFIAQSRFEEIYAQIRIICY